MLFTIYQPNRVKINLFYKLNDNNIKSELINISNTLY